MTTEAEMDALDAADRERLNALTLHGAALWYARQGLRVFPLQPGTKLPFPGSHGCKDATTDPLMISMWWAHEFDPAPNIGIATGHLVDVVDIDGHKGQRSRVQHWCAEGPDCDDLHQGRRFTDCDHGPGLFATIDADAVAKVLTPRLGGMHLYVPAQGDGNSAGIFPGVDYRGLGGYVVAPPSVLVEGLCKPDDTPGTYRFLGKPDLERNST